MLNIFKFLFLFVKNNTVEPLLSALGQSAAPVDPTVVLSIRILILSFNTSTKTHSQHPLGIVFWGRGREMEEYCS